LQSPFRKERVEEELEEELRAFLKRPAHAAKNQKRISTRAPPKRAGRALAFLTKTYHGSRIIGHVALTVHRLVRACS
jgi:hypothetical protein